MDGGDMSGNMSLTDIKMEPLEQEHSHTTNTYMSSQQDQIQAEAQIKRKAANVLPGPSFKRRPPKKFKNSKVDNPPPVQEDDDYHGEVVMKTEVDNGGLTKSGRIRKQRENLYHWFELMESIELLTEFLAKRPASADGKEAVIAGDLVSGYCESLGVYYCTECKYVFPMEKHYLEHKKAGQCIFVCTTCGESFTFKNYSHYLKHLKMHDPTVSAASKFNDKQPIAKNTLRVNNCVATKFRKYLKKIKVDDQFETFGEATLAKHLGDFYPEVRTRDGDIFKVHSFENIRYSLSRYLKSPPFNSEIDIINGPAFEEANKKFNAALDEIREAWKGVPDQNILILPADLVAVYESQFLDPSTPEGLLNRVQMNVRLFFCRKSQDPVDKYMKHTFTVDVFPTGKKCVVRQNETINEYMPEDPLNPDLCPVRTFEIYLSKLNPSCDRLWQAPREDYLLTDEIWYQNKPIGRDTLAKFIPKLRDEIPLSLEYTNLSVRLTGNSFYNRMKLTPERILAATQMKTSDSGEQAKDAAGSGSVFDNEVVKKIMAGNMI